MVASQHSGAKRFREAFEARDAAALAQLMAPNVILRSPILDLPFEGREEAEALYSVLLGEFEEIEFLAEFDDERSYVFAYRLQVGGKPLEGVDLVRFNERGEIGEVTAFMRPLSGIANFSEATGAKVARQLGGSPGAVRAATPPANAMMRLTAKLAPRMLGMRRARRG